MSAIRKSEALVKVKPLFYKKNTSNNNTNNEFDLEAQTGIKKYNEIKRSTRKSKSTNAYIPEIVKYTFGPTLPNIEFTKQPSYDEIMEREKKINTSGSEYGQYVDIGEGIKKRKRNYGYPNLIF
jgi:hypothetical protein